MRFEGKKILVLGAGASGVSAAKFLSQRGAVVGIYDDQSKQSIGEAIFVKSKECVEFEKFDMCIISPGVSINHPIAKMFVGRIITELDLGFSIKSGKGRAKVRPSRRPVVAITGTNGKTTVTKLIAKVLGKRAVMCGNVGVPVTSVAEQVRRKIAVTEVSSFMLEGSTSFVADIGIVLNVTQDHLERHGDLQEYIRCKSRLAKVSRLRILNYDDEICRGMANDNTLFFSIEHPVDGVFLRGRDIVYRRSKKTQHGSGGKEKIVGNLDDFAESRPHAIANILVTVLVCRLLKVQMRRVVWAYNQLRSGNARIQYVEHVGNVAFYNDSKATNVASCLAACRCFVMPTNLIIGGQTKNQNFEELFRKLPKTVEHVFCYGSGAVDIMAAAENMRFANITKCKDLTDATMSAFEHGVGARIVLLSPACASLDEFESYQHRGEMFTKVVKGLKDA